MLTNHPLFYGQIFIRTFPLGIKSFLMAPIDAVTSSVTSLLGKSNPSLPKIILSKFDGFARPGEMVLVLGRPGSGCSTFLKVIANDRSSYSEVTGNVDYGGISSTEIEEMYKGQVTYNQEDDDHHATLTVAQTIMFALRTKTPGNLLPSESRHDFKQSVLELLLKILGISHTANTNVGSAYVRGVSGGERKRVSIAESMVTGSSVGSWDNASRGLDASSALDFAKSLRILTDLYQMTTFVSLYQAGEHIYDQFGSFILS
jgi:ATP-binding cassette subfamily G (WHITE) protein 2 (SNQ2)